MKILIIRLSSLGDIILTQPVIAWLQVNYPEAELHFLTKAQFADIPLYFTRQNSTDRHSGKGNPTRHSRAGSPTSQPCPDSQGNPTRHSCEGRNPEEINFHVITYHKTWEFHQSLANAGYDIVIDLQAKISTWLIKLFTPHAKHYTYQKQHLLRKAIIHHKTAKAISSTVNLYFTALQELTKTQINFDKGCYPKLYLDPCVAPDLTKYLQPVNGSHALYGCEPTEKLIALFPGATHQTKMYPSQLFIRLIELLPAGYKILLLGNSKERELCGIINLASPQQTVNLAGELSMKQLISMINKADLVVTNDSGPMHIAAALGKPQIALYGSTHPRLGFAPLNDRAAVICKNLPCQPCSLHGQEVCPLRHFACMLSIQPEEIATAAKTLESL